MKRLLLVLSLVITATMAFAQSRTISGTIVDEGGEPLIGATVLEENTTNGTATDLDGKYELAVTGNPVLVISYTGYGSQRVTVGDAGVYDMTLSEGIDIDEVVVTALGIERKKDDDLSSATTVSTEDLQRSGETGVIQGLAGKTSGVQITRNSGDPGAGAYIQIRGQNTILGDASPLIILDGVPISNSSVTAGANGSGTTAGVVQQSRLNDINPDDIASVTVLKGASAAAIYGTGAANGVLVITTKSGTASGKRFSVSVNSSVSIDEINSEHQKQGLYGRGSGGAFGGMGFTGFSWGDKISDRSGGAYLRTSPDFDNTDYEGNYFTGEGAAPQPSHRTYRNQLGNTFGINVGPIYNNPGWTANNQVNDTEVNRFIVSPEVNWGITDGLTATLRYGIDYYGDARQTFFPVNSGSDFNNGGYFRDDISETTQNFFAFLTGNYDLGDKVGLNFNVGYNIYDNQYSRQTGGVTNFFINDPSKFIFENAIALFRLQDC